MHEYFLQIATLIATRSTCLRRQVGAVLVKDKHILSTGYNGAPKNLPHCQTCLRQGIPSGERHEICRGVHAEQNAIIQAAYHGTAIKDATLYCTHCPCNICAKMLINAGIEEIFYHLNYSDPQSETLLAQAEIKLTKIEYIS